MESILKNFINGKYNLAYHQFVKLIDSNSFIKFGLVVLSFVIIFKAGKNCGEFLYYFFH